MNLIAGREQKPIGIRLPAELRQKLDEAAARSGRSRNSEILVRLAESFDQRSAGKK